jgi:hypothetical protein
MEEAEMLLIARVFALLNKVMFLGMWEFRPIRRGDWAPHGWDLAHHEVEGRNGGMLMIPRERGIVWPRFLGKRFRLALKERRR